MRDNQLHHPSNFGNTQSARCASSPPHRRTCFERTTATRLGWCSWLSRMPHTHEVPSSILGSSIDSFLFLGGQFSKVCCWLFCVVGAVLFIRPWPHKRNRTKANWRRGLARWAHNPKVPRSKLGFASLFFLRNFSCMLGGSNQPSKSVGIIFSIPPDLSCRCKKRRSSKGKKRIRGED
jgi:hypothetical protein